MAGDSQKLHPLVLWAQRKDKLLLTIALEDTQEPKINLEQNKLSFSAKGGPEQKFYEATLEFLEDVIPEESKQLVTSREVTFSIKKKEEGDYWPRLLKSKVKAHWLKTDFNKWRDEDDSDVDDVNPQDMAFEDMMQQMGNINTGDPGFSPGEAPEEEEDSDDEEMPDLES